MPERQPEYCKLSNCPNWKSFCHLDQALRIVWRFNSKTGLKKERGRLIKLAKTTSEKIINKCNESVSSG